jgi:hypothetical protein
MNVRSVETGDFWSGPSLEGHEEMEEDAGRRTNLEGQQDDEFKELQHVPLGALPLEEL